MTISIQGSTAAVLAPPETLPSQQNVSAGSTPPTGALDSTGPTGDVIDVSGLAPGGPGGPASGQASSASIADAAAASGTLIEGLLTQMRDAAVSAADPSLPSDARSALSAGFQSGLSQVQAAIAAAGVDGVNLIDGSSRGRPGLAAFDFSLGGPLIGVGAGGKPNDAAAAAGLVDQLNKSLDHVGEAVGALVAQSDALQAGGPQTAGAAADPGLDADGARLAALQVQQQIASGAGSIGNQSPAAILALFR